MKGKTIMGILMDHRVSEAVALQEVLTKHGCLICARFGLHEAGDQCADEGLIILNLCGDSSEVGKLESDLKALPGIKVKQMSF